jgi:GDP/UDP-N,N'-diacetylbacillosamine 2-epimerase (hydrolysing)
LSSLKIALLTSSRADYGIYLPLLAALKEDVSFETDIVAFGTHLSREHGYTIDQITESGFSVAEQIETMPDGDSSMDISRAMGKTIVNFSGLWNRKRYDLIIALGDRYEMFAACASSVPFMIPIAHIHGGETTLGAMDDTFRHAITLMSTYHFAIADRYKSRITEIKGSDKHVYNVGALSIDTLSRMPLLSIEAFQERFNIDLRVPSILVTFHPETVAFEKNREYAGELIAALREIKDYQIIITMPNADTMGNTIREMLNHFVAESDNAIGIESFGTLGYLTCMKYCAMMLGNTSSGFVEAAFFSRYVINIGERQSGRIVTDNICNVKIDKASILEAVNSFPMKIFTNEQHIYGDGNAAQKIVSILRTIQ